ncbi:MAG: transcription factor S [Promethearchaeota archaeon]
MVEFCPKCEKMLRRKKDANGDFILECPACHFSKPYVKDRQKKKMSKALEKKILDNKTRVVGEEPSLELKPKTKVECPKCGNDEAFYDQFQTRSADEPATTFYSCTKCGHRWREY